jgi:RNase P/RNase MRP subunit p30
MREEIILREKNFNKLKELVSQATKENKEIVFYSEDDDLNRKVLEKLNIDFLLISLLDRKDYMKQRNSGFNEVLAKICKKKNVGIGIDFSEILNSREKEMIISRIKQNVSLCKKNGVRIKFFNYRDRDKKGLKAFGLVLGILKYN